MIIESSIGELRKAVAPVLGFLNLITLPLLFTSGNWNTIQPLDKIYWAS